MQTTLSAEVFAATLEQWRAAGLIETYWRHYYFDFAHPFLYGGFLSALLAKGFEVNRIPSRYDNLLLIPFVAGGFDLIENSCHVAMLSNQSLVGAPMVLLSGIAANLKWLGALGCIIAVGALALRARFRKKALG